MAELRHILHYQLNRQQDSNFQPPNPELRLLIIRFNTASQCTKLQKHKQVKTNGRIKTVKDYL